MASIHEDFEFIDHPEDYPEKNDIPVPLSINLPAPESPTPTSESDAEADELALQVLRRSFQSNEEMQSAEKSAHDASDIRADNTDESQQLMASAQEPDVLQEATDAVAAAEETDAAEAADSQEVQATIQDVSEAVAAARPEDLLVPAPMEETEHNSATTHAKATQTTAQTSIKPQQDINTATDNQELLALVDRIHAEFQSAEQQIPQMLKVTKAIFIMTAVIITAAIITFAAGYTLAGAMHHKPSDASAIPLSSPPPSPPPSPQGTADEASPELLPQASSPQASSDSDDVRTLCAFPAIFSIKSRAYITCSEQDRMMTVSEQSTGDDADDAEGLTADDLIELFLAGVEPDDVDEHLGFAPPSTSDDMHIRVLRPVAGPADVQCINPGIFVLDDMHHVACSVVNGQRKNGAAVSGQVQSFGQSVMGAVAWLAGIASVFAGGFALVAVMDVAVSRAAVYYSEV